MKDYLYFIWEYWFERDRLGGRVRSSDWRSFRAEHIHDTCDFCGVRGTLLSPLELHHVEPFHLNPELELDPDNVVTGCRTCHLKFFHLGSFKSHNPEIKEDIQIWQNKKIQRP